MTSSAPPGTPTPKQKRRKRLRRAGGGVVLGLAGALTWLFWPVGPPAYALLNRMPEDMVLGLEARSPARLWIQAREEGMEAVLADLPLAKQIAAVAGPQAERWKAHARRRARAVDRILGMPWGLGLVGRSLSGSLAVSATGPHGEDAVLLAKLDNAGWSVMRLALLTDGQSAPGLPAHLCHVWSGQEEAGASRPRTMYVTLSHGLLVAATSPDRLRTALACLADTSGEGTFYGHTSLPDEAVLLMARPNRSVREMLGEHIGVRAWLVEDAGAVITREKRSVHVDGAGRLHPGLMAAARERADVRRRERGRSAPGRMRKADLHVDGPHTAWCAGYLEPEFAWAALGARLWDSPGRPRRGESQPMTVLAWEWLDCSVIAHADGRFCLRLVPPPPAGAPDGIPAAPVLATDWGVEQTVPAAEAFRKGLQRIVDFYRAPGGRELYERVRRKTRLVYEPKEHSGRIELHPLFFNGMAPAWRMAGGRGFCTTGPAAPVASGPALSVAPNTLADLTAGWHVRDKHAQALRAFLADKIVAHGFVEARSEQQQVMQAVDLLLALARSLPKGTASVTVREEPAGTPGSGRFAFRAAIAVHLRGKAGSERP